MLKNHLYILGIFILLALPVYLVDSWLLKPQRHSSFLDLSGLFFLFYLAFIGGQIIFSSAGFWLFNPTSLATLHVISAVISILSISVGIFLFEGYGSMKSKEAHEEKMAARAALYDDMTLEKWWVLPNAEDPEEVYVEVSFKRGGRFSAAMTAREKDENSEMKFWADIERPVSVKSGDRHIAKLIVERDKPGPAPYVRISLYLFPEDPAERANNITKVYLPAFDQKDDGDVMYDLLPERSSAP